MQQNLLPLNLPAVNLRLARRGDKLMVWDELRKKFLSLSPEEWVRQHFVHYLRSLGYGPANIALEGGFRINDQLKRTDILIYKNQKTAMLVECKAPQVKLSMQVLEQATLYNLHYKVPYLLITNGLQHYCFLLNEAGRHYREINNIPPYAEL